MIAHIVYFEALASINDAELPAWKSTVAGLVVLRLIDQWLDEGPQTVTTDVTGLRAVREAIGAIKHGDPVRSILSGAVDAIMQAETPSVGVVTPHLMAYGRALHYAGDWKLAKDVYTSLMYRAEMVEESETIIQSALRLGFVNRRMAEHEESEAAYMLAEEEALRIGNKEGIVRARLGIAQNVIDSGNLPKADELLSAVISSAQEYSLSAVMADALQDRAHLHHSKGNFAEAVRYGYSALEFSPDLLTRDRILGNIAASFAELGHLQAARDAHLIVVATTQEEWLRQQTLLNLMEIAIMERHETAFHSYRRTVADATLQPIFKAYFHLYSAKGYRAFGNLIRANSEFEKAIEVASVHNFNQLSYTAETERDKVEPTPFVEAKPASTWSPELNQIASAIGQLRELASNAS